MTNKSHSKFSKRLVTSSNYKVEFYLIIKFFDKRKKEVIISYYIQCHILKFTLYLFIYFLKPNNLIERYTCRLIKLLFSQTQYKRLVHQIELKNHIVKSSEQLKQIDLTATPTKH